MKQLNLQQGYTSPQTELIDLEPISVLCQSGGNAFSTSLEDMKENEYTFTF